MSNSMDMDRTKALALLRRSDTELEVRLDLRDVAATKVVARFVNGVMLGGVAFGEALAGTAGLILLGHYRSDQEVASLKGREVMEPNLPVTLDPALSEAVADATHAIRHQQWDKYEGDRPYDPKKAARKYVNQTFDPWNALWIAAQQIGVYTPQVTDVEGVTFQLYIGSEADRDRLCALLREHGAKSIYDTALLGLLGHFEPLFPGDEMAASRAVYAHLKERIERHEAKFRQRCQESGWEYEPTLQFDPCGHHDRITGEQHTRDCYLKMADLLECVTDFYLHPALYRHKWRAARTMRHWGNTDPNAQDAKSRLSLMAFFGPEGRVRVAQAVAAVLSRRTP